MKAAILNESSKPLIIADIDIPSKLEFGQVLVRVCYSGICGAQINEIDALKGPDKFLPHLLGHEGSGIDEKIGEGVKVVNKIKPVTNPTNILGEPNDDISSEGGGWYVPRK